MNTPEEFTAEVLGDTTDGFMSDPVEFLTNAVRKRDAERGAQVLRDSANYLRQYAPVRVVRFEDGHTGIVMIEPYEWLEDQADRIGRSGEG